MMNTTFRLGVIALSVAIMSIIIFGCDADVKKESTFSVENLDSNNAESAKTKLMDLLVSLENKDIDGLMEIMSPSNEMSLIFTSGNILTSVDSFVEFHRKWFMDTSWNLTHEIVDFNFYGNFATSTVKAYYSEPLRNGKPYHHNMVVSYVLRKVDDGEWMVIKDQSTTFDKTLD